MPLEIKSKKAAANAEKAEVKAKTSAVVEAEAAVETPDENIGIDSDKLKFVAALGDPSQDDVTYIKDKETGKVDKKTDPVIVGYRFVADIDLEVPDVAPGDDLKKNLMSYKEEEITKTRLVKAGTEFDLTKFETGLLISPARFNGKATGGQIPVSCSYANTAKKTSTGAIASTSATAAVPNIAIRAITGSIKDVAPIPVLKFTSTKDPKTGQTRKSREILPGFEKWAPLCKTVVTRRSSSTGSTASKNVRNQGAAAFLQVVQSKAKKN